MNAVSATETGMTSAVGRRRALRIRWRERTVRSVWLGLGSTQIGSAQQCGLMIRDEKFPEQGFTLVCAETAATVLASEGVEVMLNGEKLSAGRRMLADADRIAVGDYEFRFMDFPVRNRSSRRWIDGLPSAPMLAVVVAAFLLTLLSLTAYQWYDRRQDVDEAAIRSRFPDVHVVQRDDDHVIEGFVHTNAEMRELQELPHAYRKLSIGAVHSVEDVLEHARNYFRGSGVIVQYAGHGRLVLSGMAVDRAVESRIKTYRSTSGFDMAVQVAYPPPELRLPRDRMIVAGRDIPALQSVYFGAGGDKYLLSAAGDKYYEGGRFADGTLVVRIQPNEIEFHRADEILRLPMGVAASPVSASRL